MTDQKQNKWTADFETNNHLEALHVWSWGVCNIYDSKEVYKGTDIESFMDWCYEANNPTVSFQNLKFDGNFIIPYLINNGYEYIDDKKYSRDRTFTTLIGDTGQFYSIEVYFEVNRHIAKSGRKYVKTRKVKFLDSRKVIPMSVEKAAKSFGLPILKGEIDYNKFREVGYQPTEEEWAYQINDVQIMAMCLNQMYDEGLTKMTTASNALSYYKDMMGNSFKKYFPELPKEIDGDIRQSYKGGFTYLNPIYEEVVTQGGYVFDVNSMYPAKMKYEKMPIGHPVFFEGEYQEDKFYPLYVQSLNCSFTLKPGKIPSIQLKHNSLFTENEYIETTNGDIVGLILTSIDLELFFENYDVADITFNGGWKFKAKSGLFTNYIDHWTETKIKSKQEGNKGKYQISKLMLNSLYGKFGTNPRSRKKTPFIRDGVVHFHLGEVEDRKSIYVPVASFITSYARAYIIRSSEIIRDYTINKYGYDGYVYSDTDSIHCLISDDDLEELSKVMEIDDYKLGAWKPESKFQKGKYIRQKCYIEQDLDGKINAVVAGMTKEIGDQVTFENFKYGLNSFEMPGITKHKKAFKYGKNGVALVDTPFSLKRFTNKSNNKLPFNVKDMFRDSYKKNRDKMQNKDYRQNFVSHWADIMKISIQDAERLISEK